MSENKPDSSLSLKIGSKEQVSQLRRPTLGKIGTYVATKVNLESRPDSMTRSSTSSRDHGTILTPDTEQFIIGQKVWVGGISPGQIAYIGETHFAPGEWAGIVLDEPNGKNDGCVAGKRYFQCEAKKGIFSRLTRLTLHPLEGAISKLAKNYSPERSRTVSPTPSTQSFFNRSMGGRHGLALGDRVIVSSGFGSRPGTLRFLGETQFASGNWCGIELDDSTGKNDGSVEGVKYFECKPKYGIFVPIAKVSLSPSSKKSRLSRAGSKESLTSIGTMNSIATTNTSRLRMQRYSMSMKQPPPSTSKSSFSMQDLLREKQNHIEQLMIERDMEQEDAQNQALQFQKIILELKSKIDGLEKNLEEEKNKTEDLQLSIEEANFCGDELNAQTQVYKEKITDLEQRLRAVTSDDENIILPVHPVKDAVIVKTEFTSTTESKYDIQQQNNQYLFNQNEKLKLHSDSEIESLNNFRDLFRKIKDDNSLKTTYQEELNRYIRDPDELRRVHSIKIPLNQMGDTFLKDLFESLALAIKEFNLISIENKNMMKKCMDFENTLNKSIWESDRLENDNEKFEDTKRSCKNLMEANEKLRKENKASEENIKQLENEKLAILEKLQVITSNCERFVGLNEQLQQRLDLEQENNKKIENEKQSISQKLEDVLANCKSLADINEKIQAELTTNAEKSNLLKGQQFDVSRKFEDISFKCKSLSEQNENLMKDLQKSEDKLRLLEIENLDVQRKNTELLTKLKHSSELNEKMQQEVSEEISCQVQKEIIDVSQKLEEMSTNCKSLSNVNEKLREDLQAAAESLRNMNEEKLEIYKKLEETSLSCKSYKELNENLHQQLFTSEAKLSRIQAEKLDVSKNLEELKMNYKILSDLSEKNKEELIANEEKSSLLKTENYLISQKLDEKTGSCCKLSELNDQLQAELKNCHEKLKTIEKENFDISMNLEETKKKFDILLKQNEGINLHLKTSHENSKLLETEKFDISQKLEEVQSTLSITLEQNENLQQKLKTVEENSNHLEKEKFELSRKFEEVTLTLKSLLEEKKMQYEKQKLLEETNFDISLKLKDAKSNYEILSDVKNKLQEEFLSKNEGNTSYCNNLMQQNEKLQHEIKSIGEKNNELQLEKLNILRNLEQVTLNERSISELYENQRQELQIITEKYKLLEIEKFGISQKLEESSSKYNSSLKTKEVLQEEFNSNIEKTKRLKEEKFEISRDLADLSSKLKSFSEENSNLQQQLKALEEKLKKGEEENFKLTGNLKKVTINCENLSQENKQLKQELLEKEDDVKVIGEKKFNLSQKLEEVTYKNETLTELSNKLEQELKTIKNNSMQLDAQKIDISKKLEIVILKSKKLENINENLQQDLKLINEKYKQNELEKTDISQKLNDIVTSYSSLSEDFGKLKEELKKNEEKTNQFAKEKVDISENLIDATVQIANLSDLNESLQLKYNISEQKFKQLEGEKMEIIKKLDNLLELNNKLEQQLKTFEEKVNKLEAERLDISGNLVDATLECKNLSDMNEELQQELKHKEQKCIELEYIQNKLEAYEKDNTRANIENLDLSKKLEKAISGCKHLKELKEQLQNDLNNQEEHYKREHSELNENIKTISANRDKVSELYQQMQTELKTGKMNAKQLEETHFNVLEELQEVKSNQNSLSELNEKLQKQIDDVSVKSENSIKKTVAILAESENNYGELSQKFSYKSISHIISLIQSLKSDLETEYFRDAKINHTMKCFSQHLSKIEAILSNDEQCIDDSSIETESISKTPLYLIEKCKGIGRIHLGNQLQDIYQLISSIKSHIENLDQDIQSIPSDNRLRTDLLNAAEEKSCKLQYDFVDLAQRFEALVVINEKYPSLNDSISKSLLDEARKIIKKQDCMVFDATDEIKLLQSIVISYQLVLKANDVETASNLIAKSSLEPLSKEKCSDEIVLQNLQSDLELTRSFINKLEELNVILRCLCYFQFKISKYNTKVNASLNNLKNDKASLEDICKDTLQLRDAEEKLKTECSELIKILANSMETFENSKKKDKLKSRKCQFIIPIYNIDKSMEIMNNIMNSNYEFLNVLCGKVKIIEEKSSDISSGPLPTDISKLDANTKTELKSENMDEKTAQINFLHSIIADMQQKNDKLKDKIETLEAFSTDTKKSYMYEMIAARKPAPRMFCDICDQFDIHETEDCPMQESDGGEIPFQPAERVKEESDGSNSRKVPATRKYCENCEAFDDHETEDCYTGLE